MLSLIFGNGFGVVSQEKDIVLKVGIVEDEYNEEEEEKHVLAFTLFHVVGRYWLKDECSYLPFEPTDENHKIANKVLDKMVEEIVNGRKYFNVDNFFKENFELAKRGELNINFSKIRRNEKDPLILRLYDGCFLFLDMGENYLFYAETFADGDSVLNINRTYKENDEEEVKREEIIDLPLSATYNFKQQKEIVVRLLKEITEGKKVIDIQKITLV